MVSGVWFAVLFDCVWVWYNIVCGAKCGFELFGVCLWVWLVLGSGNCGGFLVCGFPELLGFRVLLFGLDLRYKFCGCFAGVSGLWVLWFSAGFGTNILVSGFLVLGLCL